MELIITRPPLDLRTIAVAAGCLLGATLTGYLLYRDTHGGPVKGHSAVMGVVEKSDSFVRRKLSDSYLWDPIEANGALYRHDSVQTGPGSFARIRLKNGSVIDLGEESLVVIDDQANMSLDFVRGSAVVHDTGGDRAVQVRQDGKTEIKRISARLDSPEAYATLYARSGFRRSVQFSWTLRSAEPKPAQPEGLTLEVSTDRIFSGGGTRRFPVSAGARSTLALALPAGTYFWRLLKQQSPISITRRFEIADVRPLQPIRPALDQAIQPRSPGDPVQFGWSEATTSSTSGKSWIEISQDPSFRTLTQRTPIVPQSLTAAIPAPPEGHYYWRIQSRFPGIEVGSDPAEFRIVGSRSPVLVPLHPDPDASLGLGGSIKFEWRLEGGTSGQYSWDLERLGSSGTGATPPTSALEKGPAHLWTPMETGRYRWRARALRDGKAIAESDWRTLTVEDRSPIRLTSPTEGQMIRYWRVPAGGFSFSWQGPPLPAGKGAVFQLEVSSDPSLKAGVMIDRTAESRLDGERLKLGEGAYYWRVRMLDGAGRQLRSSPIGRFACAPNPLLPPPSSLLPVTGTVFSLNAMRREPAVEWSQVRSASSYELTFYQAGRPVLRKRVRGNSFGLGHLREGNYAWSVRSIDPLDRAGPGSPLQRFTLSSGKVLPPPEVLQRTRVVE